MSHRQSFAEINLSDLKHNADLIFDISGRPSFFCPMVKANAYGHGDIQVAEALRGHHASHLGVGLVEEAIKLRENKIREPILVFGMFDPASCAAIIENNIIPVISDLSELDFLKSALGNSKNQKLKIHIKFNTGMNRLGVDRDAIPSIQKFLTQNRNFELEGVCTHLLSGEDAGSDHGDSVRQLENFFEIEKEFSKWSPVMHALNSSAATNIHFRKKNKKAIFPPKAGQLGVRPGIALYGGSFSTQETGYLDLRPVMSLKSKLALLHSVRKDEVVSYGGKWRATRDSLIGVIPIGYADGYFRNLSNAGEVLCHGQRAPVVGTVCMDYFMVDLTSLKPQKKIEIGDEVVLFGKQNDTQILAGDLAKKVGTISYEVLARISSRVPRVFVN